MLTIEENLKLAKKEIVAQIYTGAKIEGCNVTFPETKTIIEGVNIGHISLDDLRVIQNLKYAWQYVFNNIKKNLTIDFICKVNEFVSYQESLAWGVLRTGAITITGTQWIPSIPNHDVVVSELEKIKLLPPRDIAIEYFLYGTKQQLFWDGNKRTSHILANKILIQNGQGLLLIPEKKLLEFNEKLHNYYEKNDKESLKKFLYENILYNDLVVGKS